MSRRMLPDWLALNRASIGRLRHPIHKRLLGLFHLLAIQPMREHADLKRVVGFQVNRLSPVVVEKMLL